MFESLEKDDEDEVKKASELKIEGSESIELNTNYGIELNYPVSLIDTSLIQLFKVSDDTVLTIHKYSFNNDTTHLRRYWNANWHRWKCHSPRRLVRPKPGTGSQTYHP